MIFRRWTWTGLIVSSLFWTGGCEFPPAPADTIKPPFQADGYLHTDEFLTMVRALLPDGARLVLPISGTGKHPVTFGDMDGDGVDEAVVVYEESLFTGRELKAALLKQQDRQWHIVSDLKGIGYDIDYAGFVDTDRDGNAEMILGWSLGAGVNGLDVYRWNNNALELVDNKGYYGKFKME
ncbi:hypothetical protein [Paenibacillus sp. J2TS4]|uniref:hypothetical protein n=1 Tax=Paenibacillus sp. J2TS4 TaxID=2807194 RepID=UPI001B040273|nr:hypothetical protein [Paenibacillus sp. J2TS4]GIP32799.1 hypothetical protein J2TS4_20090 [Paenibacillus sp. J2TS4]